MVNGPNREISVDRTIVPRNRTVIVFATQKSDDIPNIVIWEPKSEYLTVQSILLSVQLYTRLRLRTCSGMDSLVLNRVPINGQWRFGEITDTCQRFRLADLSI